MSDTTPSANMNMPVPVAGVDPGPQWALDINSCLAILDSHDHSAGYGVPISPGGLNISSDLSFGGNNGIDFRSVRFNSQASALVVATDLNCLYTVAVDLYYNDGLGNNVRITQSGGVAGSPGSISNLTSPASASYVAINSTFVWESDANTPANMDAAAYIFRNLSASSKGLTLSPPAAMGADYSLTLPSLPASQKIMTLDSSGVMSAPYVVDNSTIEVSTNTIQVKALGITDAELAPDSVITSKILDLNVTRPKLEAVGEQIGSSSIVFSSASGTPVDVTNAIVSITTSGRPVVVMLQPDGTGSAAQILVQTSSGVGLNQSQMLRDASVIAIYRLGMDTGSGSGTGATNFPPAAITFLDTPIAGTYVYKIQTATISGGGVNFNNMKLVAYEL